MNKGTITFIDPDFRPFNGIEKFKAQKRAEQLAELENQHQWFQDLKAAIEGGDKEIALKLVRAAILLLERQINKVR